MLESRHLVVLFLGVVLLCGVFFTLGYVMGHNQYGGAVHAADAPEASRIARREGVQADSDRWRARRNIRRSNNEWDFYSKNANNHLEPRREASSPAVPAPSRSIRETQRLRAGGKRQAYSRIRAFPASENAERVDRASGRGRDAPKRRDRNGRRAAAKEIPAFVLAPSGDNFYRVQVGPYRRSAKCRSRQKRA